MRYFFKVLLFLVTGIVAILGCLYVYWRLAVWPTEAIHLDYQMHFSERAPQGKLISLGSGWSQYTIPEWHITFSYPSDWKLSEQTYRTASGSGLASVQVEGKDQAVTLGTLPGDLPAGIHIHYRESTTTISGKATLLHEARYDDREGFSQYAAACANVSEYGGAYLLVDSLLESRDVTSKIIASVECSK